MHNPQGDIAPLAEIIQLKHKYKFRVVLDESLAVGVLGRTGRGLTEQVGAQIGTDVDIVCGSLGNALGSVGGYCVGDREMIDHQRLSGSGYCFSASNPPVLVTTAQAAIHMLINDTAGERLMRLRDAASRLRQLLEGIPGVLLLAPRGGQGVESPVLHALLHDPKRSDLRKKFRKLVDSCGSESDGVKYVNWYCDDMSKFVEGEVERGDREGYLLKVAKVREGMKARGVLVA